VSRRCRFFGIGSACLEGRKEGAVSAGLTDRSDWEIEEELERTL
jgi:hypothetical protein